MNPLTYVLEIVFALVLVLVFCACNVKAKELPAQTFTVKQLFFRPSSSSLNSGISSSGEYVFMNNSIPESYSVVLQSANGDLYPIEDKNLYSKVKIGNVVDVVFEEQRLGSWLLSADVKEFKVRSAL